MQVELTLKRSILQNNFTLKKEMSSYKVRFGQSFSVKDVKDHLNEGKPIPYAKMLINLKNLDEKITPYDTDEIIFQRKKSARNIEEKLVSTNSSLVPEVKNIVNKFINNNVSSNGKECFVVFGLPGAGKSTTSKLISERKKALIIDGDTIREVYPAYNAFLHKDVKKIIKEELLNTITDKGYNFILNTCSIHKELGYILGFLNKNNYKKTLIFLDTSPLVAIKRIIKRFNETGRFTDPYNILYFGDEMKRNYEKLKELKCFDRYFRIRR